MPAKARDWSLTPRCGSLSRQTTDEKQPEVGLERDDQFIHHVQWEHPYSGTFNVQTGEREGGSLWIADQLERLAAMTIEGCTPTLCTMDSVASDKRNAFEQTVYKSMVRINRPRVRQKEMTNA